MTIEQAATLMGLSAPVSLSPRIRPSAVPFSVMTCCGPSDRILSERVLHVHGRIPIREVLSMTGYYVKCREIQEPQQVTMKNGRPITRGECGSMMFRIGKAS